jgi:hypothetical protein
LPDINAIHDAIRARRAELEKLIEPLQTEADQLARLAATFDATIAEPAPAAGGSRAKKTRGPATRAARPASGTPRAKRGRPVGSGNRADQAVELITRQPGITASELAAAMGIGPNYLYRVLPQLQREGKITKQGKGYQSAGPLESAHANGHGVAG